MPNEKNPAKPEQGAGEIDPDIQEVMQDHTRAVRGRGPNVAREAQRKRALVKAAMNAIKSRDERAFSAELRRAGVKDGSPEWKNAWEIYRSAAGQH
jgi:hypothetical protein